MKKVVTIALATAALAASLGHATAGSLRHRAGGYPDALPPSDILAAVRSIGLNPSTRPLRRGHFYVLHAYDPYGIEMRVVADAQLGDIVSVRPTRALVNAFTPYYVRAPRIIHVPANGEAHEQPGDTTPLPRPAPTPRGD